MGAHSLPYRDGYDNREWSVELVLPCRTAQVLVCECELVGGIYLFCSSSSSWPCSCLTQLRVRLGDRGPGLPPTDVPFDVHGCAVLKDSFAETFIVACVDGDQRY